MAGRRKAYTLDAEEMMDIPNTITPDMRMTDVPREFPDAAGVFHRPGPDSRRGGGKALADASAAHGLDRDPVLAELRERATTSGGAS